MILQAERLSITDTLLITYLLAQKSVQLLLRPLVRLHSRKVGRLLMLIGFLHVLGGTWVGRKPLARIFRDGFWGEADSALGNMASEMDKELVFWFLL